MGKIALAHPFSDAPLVGDIASQTAFWATQLLIWHNTVIFAIHQNVCSNNA